MSTYTVTLCGVAYDTGALLCELVRGHAGDHKAVDIAQVGNPVVSWPEPQFEPGDRVTLEGTVIESTPGSPYIRLRMPDNDTFSIAAKHLTLIESGQCAALFPGRENEDPPPRCVKHADHTELHESAEGWRWGTIEQRTDDAHAPAEPRCKAVRPSGFPLPCWGMAGHIGPHRTPSGEWT